MYYYFMRAEMHGAHTCIYAYIAWVPCADMLYSMKWSEDMEMDGHTGES